MQAPPQAGYGFGSTITESGHVLLPWAIGGFLVGLVTAPLVGWFGTRPLIGFGVLVTGVADLPGVFHDDIWQLYVATTGQGLGSGLFSALAGVVVSERTCGADGRGQWDERNIRSIGGSVGSAVMAGIVTAHPGRTQYPNERGYEIGFVVLGALMALASAVAPFLPDLHRQTTGGPCSTLPMQRPALFQLGAWCPSAQRATTVVTRNAALPIRRCRAS